MDPRSKQPERTDRRSGQVFVLLAVMIVVLVGFLALAVDLGFLFVTRNEVQNVSDGSSLAGARALGDIYQKLSYSEQQGYSCGSGCIDTINDAAQDVALHNKAAGEAMSVRVADIVIGQWDGESFSPTLLNPDAVQVIARRDDVDNGRVATFFARALDIDSASVTTIAVAALTGQGTSGEGDLELPIGISEWFFENPEYCDDDIQFYPTNDPASCAGWTSWDYGSNDVTLRRILDEVDGYESPGTIAGETSFYFTGGTLSDPTFDSLLELFRRHGYDVDEDWNYLLSDPENPDSWIHQASEEQGAVPLMGVDNKGNPIQLTYPNGDLRNMHKWETTLPVYHRNDCSNPNQTILIVGFAQIELRDVLNAPDKLVKGIVKCNYVSEFPSRGGGGDFGTKGSIPGLVK